MDIPFQVLERHCAIPSDLTEDQLLAEIRNFLQDFKVTETQVSNLEKMTRSQAESSLWKRQRKGRITASIVHDIKTTDRKECIKKVMRENSTDISWIPAVRYGVTNERKAKEKYVENVAREHTNFTFRDCGLVVDSTFPVFAASPDGVTNCDCHGEGLVEVKCCYKYREELVRDIPNLDNTFYLEKDSCTLKKSHRYYTQVQFQMYVCQKPYCDFVVYTNKSIYVQTILYDPPFVNSLIEKCLQFANDHLLRELISRKLEDNA